MISIDKIIAFENGELAIDEVVELFAELIANGMAWSLQGSYGRMASDFIENGVISPSGEVLIDVANEF